MPELPEVEIHARRLAAWAIGRTILGVTSPPGTRETAGLPPWTLVRRLVGRTILAVSRRGKWILVSLSGEAGFGIHLGMTGTLVRCESPFGEPPTYSRATLALDDHTEIHFVDRRRFGKLIATSRYDELLRVPEIAELGPDALDELSVNALKSVLEGTTRTVKETLMNQRLIAGLGNIYATDALWLARIHPKTSARDVARSPTQVGHLYDAIVTSLRHGLRTFGSPAYPRYAEEGGPIPFSAYGRAGKPCPRCHAPFASFILGGRNTVFCRRCQALAQKTARRGRYGRAAQLALVREKAHGDR